jgi:uncharacterized membrane protein (DUF2068 family)
MEAVTVIAPRPKLSAGFVWIIVFKYVKGLSFLLLGAWVFHLARLARNSEPLEVARLLGASERKLIVQHLSTFLSAFTPRQVEAIGAAAVLIGLVFVAEGTCLWMRFWWAPYFTIALTALGIPPEIVEIVRRPYSGRRYLLLAVNAAILVYLWKRRNDFRTRVSLP